MWIHLLTDPTHHVPMQWAWMDPLLVAISVIVAVCSASMALHMAGLARKARRATTRNLAQADQAQLLALVFQKPELPAQIRHLMRADPVSQVGHRQRQLTQNPRHLPLGTHRAQVAIHRRHRGRILKYLILRPERRYYSRHDCTPLQHTHGQNAASA